MTKKTVDENGTGSAENLPEFGKLVKLKALANERFAFQRAASRAIYEALSPEEKAFVDEKLGNLALKIASQFGRSRSFAFIGSSDSERGEHNES